MRFGDESDLVGKEKDDSFKGCEIGNLCKIYYTCRKEVFEWSGVNAQI